MTEAISLLNSDLLFRFLTNFVSLVVLLRVIYHQNDAQSETMSGFLIFGNGVFFVTALLHNVDMSIGFAFGLFAVFSMLRYRTETLTVRDMTYLFVLIAISLLSSVSSLSMLELAIINSLICGLTAFFESAFFTQSIGSKTVIYEKVELISSENRPLLISDLEQRLGVSITNVEVGDVDFLRDSAVLKVYYKQSSTSKKATNSSKKETRNE